MEKKMISEKINMYALFCLNCVFKKIHPQLLSFIFIFSLG